MEQDITKEKLVNKVYKKFKEKEKALKEKFIDYIEVGQTVCNVCLGN
jgi:hypothetical protein